jgi:hypothetical protein
MTSVTTIASGRGPYEQTHRILGASAATGMSVTGTASETVLATVPIAAGAIGANGILRITSLWGVTNSANNKTVQVRLGASGNGIAGDIFGLAVLTTVAAIRMQNQIQNRNAANSQVTLSGTGTGGWGTTTGGISTATRDTSVATDLVFTGTLANTGETITLHSYLVELIRVD